MSNKKRHRHINPVARAPILRKGGVHEKSRSAKRQAAKRQLRKLIAQEGARDSGPIFLVPAQSKRHTIATVSQSSSRW